MIDFTRLDARTLAKALDFSILPKETTQAEIRETFRQGWVINYTRETEFDTNLGSRKCNAWISSITLIDSGIVKGS